VQLTMWDQRVELFGHMRRSNSVLLSPDQQHWHFELGDLHGHVVADRAL